MAEWSRPRDWSGIAEAGRIGRPDGPAGLQVRLLDGLRLATVMAQHGGAAAFATAFEASQGIPPPEARRAAVGRDAEFVWTGPDRWLAITAASDIGSRLRQALGGVAAVVDQSDGLLALRLSGPRARDTLAKGCLIDLHPRAFGPRAAASTRFGYIAIQLRQIDPAPIFELLVARSLAASFWQALRTAGAEFGIEVG